MTILPMDEINALEEKLKPHFEDDGKGRIKSRQDAEEIIDELLDLFLIAYASGVTATSTELGTVLSPSVEDIDAAVFAEVAGETWKQRVMDYYDSGGTLYDIQRIAETDATRIYNQGALDTVSVNNAQDGTVKRWVTMMDDRVRDTHSYLEGMEVPYNARFYTYDGDSAEAPGMFSLPENNINCRCVVEIIRG
jgi:hypothetical protein